MPSLKKKPFILKGVSKSWETHEKLPTCSLRQLLTRFVDVTSPPSSQLLKLLANYCADKIDEESLTRLINVSCGPIFILYIK